MSDFTNPLVSIVIPTYNHAEYLPRSLGSALAQTWPHVEVIVVDDGSTDDTSAILRPWLDRVRYIRQPNRGLGAARNTGLSLAAGAFIQFLDADDTIYPAKIETQIAPMLFDASVALVYSDMDVVENGRRKLKLIENAPQTQLDLVRRFFRYNLFQPNALLIRREALLEAGGFDESRDAQEDWDLWLRMACDGYRFVHVPGVYATYWRDGSRITRDPEWMYRRYRHFFQKFVDSERLLQFGEPIRREFIYGQNIDQAISCYNYGHWARARYHLWQAIAGSLDGDRPALAILLVKAVVHELVDRVKGKHVWQP